MRDYVQHPDMRVLTVLLGMAGHYGRTWCNPFQRTILREISRRTGRTMSRRTLCRHLGALIRDGWLEKIVRHFRRSDGELELRATAHILTLKAQRWGRALWKSVGNLLTGSRMSLTLLAVPDWAQSLDTEVMINLYSGAPAPPKR